MSKLIDLTGFSYGRLLVLERSPHHKRVRWVCRCQCGRVVVVEGVNLKSHRTRSCGCLNAEVASKRESTHGHTRGGKISPEYRSWALMIRRCYNRNSKDYPEYGGRGIIVCDRWRKSFSCFLEDMGSKPSGGYSLDRINNEGNYELGNCRWETPMGQANNRRSNSYVEWRGERQTLAQWAREVGIPPGVIAKRLVRGWDVEESLTSPLGSRRRKLVR